MLGNDFPKGESKKGQCEKCAHCKHKTFNRAATTEQFIEELVPVDIRYFLQIDCEVSQNGWRPFFLREFLKRGNEYLQQDKKLDFYISETNCPWPYEIWWKVRNVGPEAQKRNMVRGSIEKTNDSHHREHTNFYGPHYVECFLIKNGICVARDCIDVPIGFV